MSRICSRGSVVRALRLINKRLPVLIQALCFCPSGLCIWNPDFWYMYGISMVYLWYIPSIWRSLPYVWYIYGICMVYPWIYHTYVFQWIFHVYPRMYMVYPDSIYMTYLCLSMVYVFMDIHGISLDIL